MLYKASIRGIIRGGQRPVKPDLLDLTRDDNFAPIRPDPHRPVRVLPAPLMWRGGYGYIICLDTRGGAVMDFGWPAPPRPDYIYKITFKFSTYINPFFYLPLSHFSLFFSQPSLPHLVTHAAANLSHSPSRRASLSLSLYTSIIDPTTFFLF